MGAAQGLSPDAGAEAPEQAARAYAHWLLGALGLAPERELALADEHPALSWAGSGLMALTGVAEGPPRLLPSALAACADGALAALASLAPAGALDGLRGSWLLAERAAYTGWLRAGAVSMGGSCRLLATADGELAVNLAREDDWALLPAWLETDVAADWPSVAAALRKQSSAALVEQGRLLGLALARSPEPQLPPWLLVTPSFPLSPCGRGVGERGGARSVPLSFAKELRGSMTDAEKALWFHLRAGRLQGHKFKRQVPLGRYVLDFVCFGSKLVVELDGSQHLDSLKDEQRDAWLRHEGFRVLRFWNHQVVNQGGAVLEEILCQLEGPLSPTQTAIGPCMADGVRRGEAVLRLLPPHLPQGERGSKKLRPRVVDLSSLWAGPLCGHLLLRLGAEVVKVESTQRPDGARRGAPEFFDLLNAGKRSVALDLGSAAGREQLRALLGEADIVIEASRPRALRQMGISAEQLLRKNPGLTWLSLSGYGRAPEWENAIAYGDDAGVAAGLSALLRQAHGEPLICGDAIADPLTGIHAALAAWASWRQGGGQLLALSLSGVVRAALDFDTPSDVAARMADWSRVLAQSGQPVAAPRRRPGSGTASALGADTAAVFADWGLAC
ncbi:DUF559 domain-containing protein [Stagnimonas aquatica]|uniref:DUF559 domain-containing protein n=1 Tax=Stagnimonas aquatica TaxID=2689987 RepID=A0A3N0V1N8_9GAMM|nr:CoA transferase [Stagnimonas aquatica]ROH86716.1 DUF559 domain-containing protein [Stagnimonas aquatica]